MKNIPKKQIIRTDVARQGLCDVRVGTKVWLNHLDERTRAEKAVSAWLVHESGLLT